MKFQISSSKGWGSGRVAWCVLRQGTSRICGDPSMERCAGDDECTKVAIVDSLAPARSALAGLSLRAHSFRRLPSGSSPKVSHPPDHTNHNYHSYLTYHGVNRHTFWRHLTGWVRHRGCATTRPIAPFCPTFLRQTESVVFTKMLTNNDIQQFRKSGTPFAKNLF